MNIWYLIGILYIVGCMNYYFLVKFYKKCIGYLEAILIFLPNLSRRNYILTTEEKDIINLQLRRDDINLIFTGISKYKKIIGNSEKIEGIMTKINLGEILSNKEISELITEIKSNISQLLFLKKNLFKIFIPINLFNNLIDLVILSIHSEDGEYSLLQPRYKKNKSIVSNIGWGVLVLLNGMNFGIFNKFFL